MEPNEVVMYEVIDQAGSSNQRADGGGSMTMKQNESYATVLQTAIH